MILRSDHRLQAPSESISDILPKNRARVTLTRKGDMSPKLVVSFLSALIALSSQVSAGEKAEPKASVCIGQVGQESSGTTAKRMRYQSVSQKVKFQSANQSVVGTLTLPKSKSKAPLVLLLHGFTGDQDEVLIKGTNERLYQRAARIFAEYGLSSLRFDFRGSGSSEGNWGATTFSKQSADVSAAIDFAESVSKVDTSRLGLLGWSQGGLVALHTAATDHRIRALALWNPVTDPIETYSTIMGRDNVRRGFDLSRGGDLDQIVGKHGLRPPFFAEIFSVHPIADAATFDGPLMVIAGTRDPLIKPAADLANLLADERDQKTEVVLLDADHSFNSNVSAEKVDLAIYCSLRMLKEAL